MLDTLYPVQTTLSLDSSQLNALQCSQISVNIIFLDVPNNFCYSLRDFFGEFSFIPPHSLPHTNTLRRLKQCRQQNLAGNLSTHNKLIISKKIFLGFNLEDYLLQCYFTASLDLKQTFFKLQATSEEELCKVENVKI